MSVFLSAGTNLSEMLRVNEICHQQGIKFLCGAVFGFYGYFFSDLGTHEYSE